MISGANKHKLPDSDEIFKRSFIKRHIPLAKTLAAARDRFLGGFFRFIDFILRERERNINLLYHLFMHSLVDSCMCSDKGSNSQPWCMML